MEDASNPEQPARDGVELGLGDRGARGPDQPTSRRSGPVNLVFREAAAQRESGRTVLSENETTGSPSSPVTSLSANHTAVYDIEEAESVRVETDEINANVGLPYDGARLPPIEVKSNVTLADVTSQGRVEVDRSLVNEGAGSVERTEESFTEGLGRDRVPIASGDQSGQYPSPSSSTSTSHASSSRRHRVTPDAYPGLHNDDSSTDDRVDSLGMTDDAKAFARVATSVSTPPPLAIGLLGPWGAGKSFFMEMIQKEVEKLSPPPSKKPIPAQSGEFQRSVIQIRFNAWHYQEANLWASLVGHIFQELANETSPQKRDDVLGRLNTARSLTLDAAASLVHALREHNSAAESLEVAKRDLAMARAKDISSGSLFVRVMKDALKKSGDAEIDAAKTKLKEAAKSLGIPEVVTATNELTEAGIALMRDGIQGAQAAKAIAQNLGSVWRAMLFLVVVAIAPVAVAWGLSWLLGHFETFVSSTRNLLIGVAAAATALTAAVNLIAKPVAAALGKLKSAQALLESHVAAHNAEYEELAERHRAQAAKAKADVDAASDSLQATSNQLSKVRESLHGQSPANRLIQFIQARAAEGDYAKHLGIISTIRKDFEQLSALLSPPTTEKIFGDVLSDFDQFKIQIEALIESAQVPVAESHPASTPDGGNLANKPPQKKQLLKDSDIKQLRDLIAPIDPTAMPFNRIVLYIDDVDRCPPAKVVEVLQAVHMLLAFKLFVVFVAVDVEWVGSSLAHEYKGMLKELESEGPLTSAASYLEKIFQIPYWLPTVTIESGQRLIQHLNPLETSASKRADAMQARVSNRTATGDKFPEDPADPSLSPTPTMVALGTSEIEALKRYSEIIDSPRKMKRLINVARFAKARGYFGDTELDGDSESPIRARALIALLTLATASPEAFSQFRYVLQRMEKTTLIMYAYGLRSNEFLNANPPMARLAHIMNADQNLEVILEKMLDFYEIAARLSFVIADKQPVYIAHHAVDFASMPGGKVRKDLLWQTSERSQ